MLSKVPSAKSLYFFVLFAILAVPCLAQIEVDPPISDNGDPNGEAIDIRGGGAYRIGPGGILSTDPVLLNLQECEEDGATVVDYSLGNLRLGATVCSCDEGNHGDCGTSACDLTTADPALEGCGYMSACSDSASAKIVGLAATSPLTIYNPAIDVCYDVDVSVVGTLLVRVANTPEGVAPGYSYFEEFVESAYPTDPDETGECPAGMSGKRFLLPPLLEGSYNVQISLWESTCDTGPIPLDEAGILSGGETENWVLRVGLTGSECDTPVAFLQVFDPADPDPGMPDETCEEFDGTIPGM